MTKEEAIQNIKKLIGFSDTLDESIFTLFPELKESEKEEKPNGGIVLEDFNEGDGFYKVNLAYLNKEQVEEIENIVKKWKPELKESESKDERIRKAIIELLKEMGRDDTGISENVKCMIAYLEKQKINTEGDFGRGYDCGYKACLNSHGAEFFEKQKEQKPIPSREMILGIWELGNFWRENPEARDGLTQLQYIQKYWNEKCDYQEEQRSIEWSEEDEHRCKDAIYFLETAKKHYAGTSEIELTIEWLKSLRPQPHKETYQAAKHDLAIRFMNYLDENRPEGKMCLSNGECEDIDKAFKENDWAKIIRYVKKYQAQSEQKPEVKHIGWVARDSKHDSYLGLGLVLFKEKPIRSGDCWTGVIDSQLPWESFPDLKWEDEPVEVEVEVTIRKK